MKYFMPLFIILIFSCDSRDIIKEEDQLVKDFNYFKQQYQSLIGSDKKKDINDFLEELKKAKLPETVVFIIPFMFHKEDAIVKNAYNSFNSYRKFTIYDMSLHFYDYLDSWLRSSPKIIVEQLGLKKSYEDFLKERSLLGERNEYYEENPIRFVLKEHLSDYMRDIKELSPLKQFWTLWIVGNMRIDDEIPFVIKLLNVNSTKTTDLSDIRFSAIWALSRFNDRQYHKYFAPLVKEANPYLQEMIAYSVSKLYDKRFNELFFKILPSEESWISPRLKSSIIWGLNRMDHQLLEPVLLNPKYENQNTWVRAQRLWALHSSRKSLVEKILVKSLKDEKKVIRNLSLICIKNRDNEKLVPQLYPLLKENDQDIKLLILQLIRKYNRQDSIDSILPLLNDSDKIKIDTIITIGKLKSKKAVPNLIEIIQSKTEALEIKLQSVKALIILGDKSALNALTNFYTEKVLKISEKKPEEKNKKSSEDENYKDFPQFTQVLIALADKEDVFKLFESGNKKVIGQAIEAIPFYKDKIKDFRFLNNLLETGDKEIQISTIKVMGEVGYSESFNLLKRIINNKKLDKEIRVISILSLARLKQEKVYGILLEKIGSTDLRIKNSALFALSLLKDPKGLEILESEWEITGNAKGKAIIIFSFIEFNKAKVDYLEEFNDLFIKNQGIIMTLKKELLNYLTINEQKRIFQKLTPYIAKGKYDSFKELFEL